MLQRLSDIQSILLKGLLILAIIAGAIIVGINIVGNIALARANRPPEASYPSVSKAQYQFTLKTTGQVLFAEKYDSSKDGAFDVYILKYGHYEDLNGRWVWRKAPMPPMDERYFGEIKVERRE